MATSGNHLARRTELELQVLNAALDAFKQRHGFEGFHLDRKSAGSRLLAGLVALRHDTRLRGRRLRKFWVGASTPVFSMLDASTSTSCRRFL